MAHAKRDKREQKRKKGKGTGKKEHGKNNRREILKFAELRFKKTEEEQIK